MPELPIRLTEATIKKNMFLLPFRRKYLVVYLFGLFFGHLAVFITVGTAEEGSHAAEFLSHGVGARALGMGSMFVSIADDATATYWNPAGLSQIEKHAFSATYSESFGIDEGRFLNKGLVQYNFVNYIQQIENIGTVGISWIRLGVDDIPLTTFVDTNGNGILGDFDDKNNNKTKEAGELYVDLPIVAGTFSNTDNAVLISYARQVKQRIAIGGNLKLLRQSIFENRGNGFGIDLGLLLGPYRGLRIGMTLVDATSTQIRWNTKTRPTFTRDPRLRLGTSYHTSLPVIGKVTLGADLETNRVNLEDDENSSSNVVFRYGVEYWLFNVIALRIGAEEDELAAGAGLRLPLAEAKLFLDYAFNAHDLGDSQRISISGLF